MSRRPDYIPRNMMAFFAFTQDLLTTIMANAGIWNLPASAVTELQDAITAFGPVFSAVTNKEKRTRQQMVAYQTARTQLEAQLRSFVQSFLVNNASIPMAERVGMELNPRGFTPRQPKGSITVAPIVALVALGGGKVRLRFKRPDSNGRTSMLPDSTGIAYYFRFQSMGNAPIPVPPSPTPVPPPPMPLYDQATAPEGAAKQSEVPGLPAHKGYELEVVTRASIERQVSLDRIGSVMHVFAQYINSSKPANNGPYSMVVSVVIG